MPLVQQVRPEPRVPLVQQVRPEPQVPLDLLELLELQAQLVPPEQRVQPDRLVLRVLLVLLAQPDLPEPQV